MLIGDYGNKWAFFYGAGSNFNDSRFFVINRFGMRSSSRKIYWFLEAGVGNGGGGFIGSGNVGITF
jgi:hypothetical protein